MTHPTSQLHAAPSYVSRSDSYFFKFPLPLDTAVLFNLSYPDRHVEASMETVEVANKELKVETRLRNIENRWKEEQLGFVRHRDTEVTYSVIYKLRR